MHRKDIQCPNSTDIDTPVLLTTLISFIWALQNYFNENNALPDPDVLWMVEKVLERSVDLATKDKLSTEEESELVRIASLVDSIKEDDDIEEAAEKVVGTVNEWLKIKNGKRKLDVLISDDDEVKKEDRLWFKIVTSNLDNANTLLNQLLEKKGLTIKYPKINYPQEMKTFELLNWGNIYQALQDGLPSIETKREKSKTAIMQKLEELNKTNLSDQEKIRTLANFLVEEYRKIIRSTHGALSLFGGGSRLARWLKQFCNKNLFFTLPATLQKGERLNLNEPNNNIVINRKFHLMVYGKKQVTTANGDRQQLVERIKEIVLKKKDDWRNQTLSANIPTGVMRIINLLNDCQPQQSNIKLLIAIQQECASRLKKKNDRSSATEAFYKAICQLNIYDKVSINNVINSVNAVKKQLDADSHTQSSRDPLRYRHFCY